MRISDLYKDHRITLSFEVFPPKTPQGLEPLFATVVELGRYRPGFISCTYGAGGSTRSLTLEIVREIRKRAHTPATAHFTCVGSTVAEIREFLQSAANDGVENIMALRGDPPQGQTEFKPVPGGLRYAIELVQLIRQEFPHFGIGVAGYPETHQEASSPEADLANLKKKVDAGADAVFTQLFYDNQDFLGFRDRCRRLGIDVPIIPGLLPILSLQQIQRITSLCKSKLPPDLVAKLEQCAGNSSAQLEVGINHCARQVEGLIAAGVPGIHFYVLNRSDSVAKILASVGIEPSPQPQS